MANNYDVVMQEVDRRVAALVHKGLTEIDATSKVFRDDHQLYQRYAKASAEAPEPIAQAPRLSAEPRGVEAEVMRRADGLIAKSAGLSYADALGEVFRADPELYVQYAKGDGTPAPTFGSELLSSQMDEFYDMTGALLRTMAGVLDSSAQDKGVRIAGALGEFTAAVLGKLRQAGLSVPTPAEKRASISVFIPDTTQLEIIRTAKALSPGDYQKGMQGINVALQEIRGWAAERGAA